MPDLVLVLVVAWALLRGPVAGAAVGLAAGWLLDLVPPGSAHLGVQALTYAAAGAFAGRARIEGPVAAPRVALVALGASAVVEGVGVLGALAVGAPVDLGAVACSASSPPPSRRSRCRSSSRPSGTGAPEVRMSRRGRPRP